MPNNRRNHTLFALILALAGLTVAATVTLFQANAEQPTASTQPGSFDAGSHAPPAFQHASWTNGNDDPEIVQNDAQVSPAQATTGFVIDRHSVALFDQIPSEYLAAARNTHMMFSDRSVGQNINEGLDCLAASSWGTSPAHCRRDYYDADWNWKTFTQADRDNGLVPQRILFDASAVQYNRSNWTFEFRAGTWSELTQDFIEVLAPAYIDSKDVLSYQFSYLNVDAASDIADPNNGFFANNANRYDIHNLEAYIAQHPDKTFFFWTTSLARSIGTQPATDFNNQMRQYAIDNDKILFDVADILSHTDTGAPCFDNRGDNLPAICQDYTTESEGGHLGSVSAGKIMVAKAFWVLMARIAGWDGGSTQPPATSTPIPSATVTPTNSTTPTLTPTVTPTTENGVTPTLTPTYTPTNTMTPTIVPTNGPLPTATPTPQLHLPALSHDEP